MEKKKKVEKVNVRTFDRKTNAIFNILIGLFAISCIIPFIFVIIISFTDESYLINHGYSFFQMSGQLRLTSIFFREPCPIES